MHFTLSQMLTAPHKKKMTAEEMTALFVPNDAQRRSALVQGKRLVHYTSAEAGYRIISGSQVWLRNAMLMNDFSEIQHGVSCLEAALSSPAGDDLGKFLEEVFPGLHKTISKKICDHSHIFKVATFMISLSEHEDDEDEFGRLSMWRAYGGKSGIALIMNPTVFTSDTNVLKVFSAPVEYLTQDKFVDDFTNWVNYFVQQRDKLIKLGQVTVNELLFLKFRLIALCTKHPGFQEEKEWRVFHSPYYEGSSDWLTKENEVIDGFPQEIVKLRLESKPESGVTGLSPKELVNRIIIGPSAHPVPIYHALHNALANAGVQDPQSLLTISEIPLRR